jgi:hypothetical protein
MQSATKAISLTPIVADDPQFQVKEGETYYWVRSTNENPKNITLFSHNLTSVTSNYVESDVRVFNRMTNTWDYQTTESKTFTYDNLIWGNSFSPVNDTTADILVYNNTRDNLCARFESSWGGITLLSSSIATAGGLHRISFTGTANTHAINFTATINATIGVMVYFRFQNDTNWEQQELAGWNSVDGKVFPVPDTFGFMPGEHIDIYHPKVDEDYVNVPDHWARFDIDFIYRNFEARQDVVIASRTDYNNSSMSTPLSQERFREEGRIPFDVISYGESHFYMKNLPIPSLSAGIQASYTGMGYSTLSYTSGSDWYEYYGTKGGETSFISYKALPNRGFPAYFRNTTYNAMGELIGLQWEITIGPNNIVDNSDPLIGVSVNDQWDILAQTEYQRYEWWSEGSDSYSRSEMIYMEVTVTHIFALNSTFMAVFGDFRQYRMGSPGTHGIILHEETFIPFMIFDSANPVNFLGVEPFLRFDGPPMIFPTVTDWTLYETALQTELAENILQENQIFQGLKIFSDTIYASTIDDGTQPGNYSQSIIELQMDTLGRLVRLEMNSRDKREFSPNNGMDRWENTRGYMVDLFDPVASPTGLTNLKAGSVLTWQREKYRPPSAEDQGSNPCDWEKRKYAVDSNVPFEMGLEGSLLVMGQQYYQKKGDANYMSKYWEEDFVPYVPNVNYWMLSALTPGDIWSIMNSDIIPISTPNFDTVPQTVADMLNFALQTPVLITPAHLVLSGKSIEAEISYMGVTYVLKISFNNEGIMQDMFMGSKNSDGTWRDWERTVLIYSSDGFPVGMVFTTGLPEFCDYALANPEEEPPAQDQEDPQESPFINGYPISMISLIAVLGMALSLRKRRN